MIHGPRTSISPTDSPSHGRLRAVGVDDAHLDAGGDAAGLQPPVDVLGRCRARRRRGGKAMPPSGLVSVIPQPWMMRRPYRCSNVSSSAAARPRRRTCRRASEERSMSWLGAVGAGCALQMVGTAEATVGCSAAMNAGRSARAAGTGRASCRSAPDMNARVGQAPGVDVEHRHDGQHPVGLGDARAASPTARAMRVQEGRAVRVDDALRVAGGAARVAHRRGRPFVELGPGEAGLLGGDAARGSAAPSCRRARRRRRRRPR